MKFTNQELFDKAYRAILAQGKPSSTRSNGDCATQCVYNGPNGTSCAFGHLVPPELRHLLVEDKVADHQVLCVSQVRDYFGYQPMDSYSIFNLIQRCHDIPVAEGAYDFIGEFKRHMKSLAAHYSLTVPKEQS